MRQCLFIIAFVGCGLDCSAFSIEIPSLQRLFETSDVVLHVAVDEKSDHEFPGQFDFPDYLDPAFKHQKRVAMFEQIPDRSPDMWDADYGSMKTPLNGESLLFFKKREGTEDLIPTHRAFYLYRISPAWR